MCVRSYLRRVRGGRIPKGSVITCGTNNGAFFLFIQTNHEMSQKIGYSLNIYMHETPDHGG